jgi:hypothetical protein
MKVARLAYAILMAVVILCAAPEAWAQDVRDLSYEAGAYTSTGIQSRNRSFDGYTNHWEQSERTWLSARGLFLLSQPTAQGELHAMEEEIGNQLLLEELWIQPGFIKELAERSVPTLNSPSPDELGKALSDDDVLACLVDRDPLARMLLDHLPDAFQFRRNRAFFLRDGSRTVFVLACHSAEELDRLRSHIQQAVELVLAFDFHRGLAGVNTNFLTITSGQFTNPFALIADALRLGCSWVMVSGYNDWMLAGPVKAALAEINFPFTFISGQSVSGGVLYGLERYPDVQDNTIDEALDWAASRGGYYFGSPSEAKDEKAARYHGYILGSPSDQEQVNALSAPFVAQAGEFDNRAPTTMVVFLDKGTPPSQDSIMDAILARRAVAVYEKGVVAGPPHLRDALRILLLEQVCLEEQMGGGIELDAAIKDQQLKVSMHNRTNRTVRGDVRLQFGKTAATKRKAKPRRLVLAPHERRVLEYSLRFAPEASGRSNLVGAVFSGEGRVKHALAHVDLPSVVEMHPLILDVPGEISYPVTVWNMSKRSKVSVDLAISEVSTGDRVVSRKLEVGVRPWEAARLDLDLNLEAGDYIAEATALGVTGQGTISVRSQPGEAVAREEDIDGDGIPEIVMENGVARATVLLYGGRVIEYTVKSRDENLLFKLWPEKPPMYGKPGGTRSFFPYGGLEEFIGYPYIGGHIVYQHEILRSSGSYARVKVWANIHGSKIAKEYTLYADSPVLEARYAFDDMTPTLNVIAINPLFQIGPSTGPEDRYVFPEDVQVETRPELERYYGRALFPKEGWAAGYDTEADIALIVGYPVDDALYLHLWNNHPGNTPTPYYYTEIQPWFELKHGTTTYFSYYLFGQDGPWEPALEEFRSLGITTKTNKTWPWNYRLLLKACAGPGLSDRP